MIDLDALLKHEDLFLTEYQDGTSFYWRLLTLKEYYLFRSLLSKNELDFDVWIKIFNQIVLLETDLLNRTLPLGYIVNIAKMAMFLSGESDDLAQEIDALRQVYHPQSIIEVIKTRICTAFTNYTPTDLVNMSRSELLRLFVQAENVLEARIQGYKRIDFSEKVDEIVPEVMSIDFEQDAALQKQQLGFWAEFEEPSQSPVALSQAAARKLDSRRKPQ